MKVTEINVPSFYTQCSSSTYPVNAKLPMRKAWVKKHELYHGEILINDIESVVRIMTPVVIKNITYETDTKPIYMMDAITGTLYDIIDGRALTSDDVRLMNFVFKHGLEKKLLSIKSSPDGGW